MELLRRRGAHQPEEVEVSRSATRTAGTTDLVWRRRGSGGARGGAGDADAAARRRRREVGGAQNARGTPGGGEDCEGLRGLSRRGMGVVKKEPERTTSGDEFEDFEVRLRSLSFAAVLNRGISCPFQRHQLQQQSDHGRRDVLPVPVPLVLRRPAGHPSKGADIGSVWRVLRCVRCAAPREVRTSGHGALGARSMVQRCRKKSLYQFYTGDRHPGLRHGLTAHRGQRTPPRIGTRTHDTRSAAIAHRRRGRAAAL